MLIKAYSGCDNGTEVIFVRFIGGSHTWPGGNQYQGEGLGGLASREINASEMILDFFLEHNLPN